MTSVRRAERRMLRLTRYGDRVPDLTLPKAIFLWHHRWLSAKQHAERRRAKRS